jgi:alanine racemase
MCRLGFSNLCDLEEVLSLSNLQIEGIYTHYAQGDMGEAGATFTHDQYDRFLSAVQYVQKRVPHPLITHAGNSGATLDFPHLLGGGARVGILLYGITPSPFVTRETTLKSVMTLLAPILHIREVMPLTPVGYGSSYITPAAMKLAYIPLGYADGIRREWVDMGVYFTVHGIPCKIVGRVCMDSCLIDVTQVSHVKLGDEAVLFGDGGQDALSLASQCHTIPYEILTGVGERVQRVYIP